MKNEEISATDAASRLGLTAQAIGQWTAKSGAPARREGARVFVQWPAFARWREEQLIAKAREEERSGDYERERTRKMAAEASIAELELAKLQGELVTVTDYGEALGRVLDRLTARLRALPLRLSHIGTDAETAAEAEIERVITELNAFDEDVLDEPAHDDAAEEVAV
jgi:phage terminase Nu1 subunit (DNA packaging protein)